MPFLDNEKDFFITFSRLSSAELCVLPSSFYIHICDPFSREESLSFHLEIHLSSSRSLGEDLQTQV